jgi:hypothetical protein
MELGDVFRLPADPLGAGIAIQVVKLLPCQLEYKIFRKNQVYPAPDHYFRDN